MTSSSGWLRSNILYDTLSDTPPPGSPLEAVCASVFVHRQKAEFLKYKTLVQATVTPENKDATQELLDTLHNEMFPDVEVSKANQSEIAKGIMERQLAKGPEFVQVLGQ
jgi:hypothetical protein